MDKLLLFNTVPAAQLDVDAFAKDLRNTMAVYVGEHDSMHAPGARGVLQHAL